MFGQTRYVLFIFLNLPFALSGGIVFYGFAIYISLFLPALDLWRFMAPQIVDDLAAGAVKGEAGK